MELEIRRNGKVDWMMMLKYRIQEKWQEIEPKIDEFFTKELK